METEYRRELNKVYLIIRVSALYEEDYQIRMLKENQIEGLVSVIGRGVDQNALYEYDISGKTSLKSMYERRKMTEHDMEEFLIQLTEVTARASDYLLDVNRLLLEPDYIFYEDGKYEFCYFPPGTGNIRYAFHELTEYFVRQTDYGDEASVKLAFMLHKETMEENYSLKKILDASRTKEDQNIQDVSYKEQRKESVPIAVAESGLYGYTIGEDAQPDILKDTDNLWEPVRKFLQKHKKPKWGDWDGLYIEEDEL